MTRLFLILFLLLFAPVSVLAACTNPAGNEADIVYNSTYKIPQYCNGTDWISWGSGYSQSEGWQSSGNNLYFDSGNVGIGTSEPNTMLEVVGGSGTGDGTQSTPIIIRGNSWPSGAAAQLQFDIGDNDTAGPGYGASIAAVDTGGYNTSLHFRTKNNSSHNNTVLTASDTQMVIDKDGNVGIGTNDPSHLVDVYGGIASITSTAGILKLAETDNSNVWWLVADANTFSIRKNNIGPYPIRISDGNTAYVNGQVATSDKRLKKDFEPIRNVLLDMERIDPVFYRWNDKNRKSHDLSANREVGFIAQEVEAVYPELVATDPDGYKAVAYEKMTAVLFQAVKELKTQNDALKAFICRDHTSEAFCQN